jgi:HEAT repeat protein
LVELLKNESPAVRAHAACSLGEIGKPAKTAVPALVELLKDTDETVRRQVVKAVMRIRPGPAVTIPLCVRLLEDSDPGVRMRILNAISEAGVEAMPGLIGALGNEKAAYWACLVLRDIGPAAKDAVPALTEKLQDSRPEIRREAILTLAAMDAAAKPAVPQIAAALSDQDTRTAATYALGRIGKIPADAEATIRKNSKDKDKVLATVSLWALAKVNPDDKDLRRDATEQLIARLKDRDPMVRVAAARALSALPPEPEITVPLWEKAFQDADETTVMAAMDALAALGPAAVPRLIEGLKHEKARGSIAYVLGKIGPDAAPASGALAGLVGDKNERVAEEAILALANIGPGAKEAVPSLIEALKEGQSANAHEIVYALGKIGRGAVDAEPVLTELLKSSDKNLALTAAWALVHIRPTSEEVAAKTLPILTAGLTNPLPLARQGAAEGLGALGSAAKEAIPALQLAGNDKEKAVRAAAAKALNSIGTNKSSRRD